MQVRASIHGGVPVVSTDGRASELSAAASGAELLLLSLAACWRDALYREAARRGIRVDAVDVEVDGLFGGAGEVARDVVYRATVAADCSEEDLAGLIWHTDTVAEVHNTLRAGVRVELAHVSARTTR